MMLCRVPEESGAGCEQVMTDTLEFISNIDLKGNSIIDVVIDAVDTEPSGIGAAGQVKSYGGTLYVGTGSGWTKLGQASSADEVATRVGALESWKATAQAAIEANATKAANNESAITTLSGRVDTAEGDIDTLEVKVSTLEGDNTQNKTDIAALKTAVGSTGEGDSLTARVSALETNIATKQDSATAFTDTEAASLKTELEGKINAKADGDYAYSKGETDSKLALYRTIADSYSKTEVDTAISNASSRVYRYKGSLADLAAIQAVQSPVIGDVYNAEDTGKNYAWDGTAWDDLGGSIDLSSYATISYVDGKVTDLTGLINGKVAQDAYNTKISSIEGRIGANESAITTLQGDVADKVDQTAYDTKMGQLDSAIAGKAAKVTQAGGTYTKVTVNEEGIVSGGVEKLVADDIPAITAAKISDFATAVKAVRFAQAYTSVGTSQTVAHGLGVMYPQVSVYNTTTGNVIYATIHYTDENTIVISGNVDLGSIYVVVSP